MWQFFIFLKLFCFFSMRVFAETESHLEKRASGKEYALPALEMQLGERDIILRNAYTSYAAKKYESSKFHLLQLIRTSSDREELDALMDDYASVIKMSPWSFGIDLSILPSTNIDKTSSNAVFINKLGEFIIPGGGQEESGAGISVGGTINYDVSARDGYIASYTIGFKREIYPAHRLNNIELLFRPSLRIYYLGGSVILKPYVLSRVYDIEFEPKSISYGVNAENEIILSQYINVGLKFGLGARDFDELNHLDSTFASVGWDVDIKFHDSLNVMTGIDANRESPVRDYLEYDRINWWIDVARKSSRVGIFGITSSYGMRNYNGDFPALGFARQDTEASFGFYVKPLGFKSLDVNPSVSCRYRENWSNVDLYDFNSTDCNFNIEKRF